MFDKRKIFEEPELEIIKLLVADVITTSGGLDDTDDPIDDEDDWGTGIV